MRAGTSVELRDVRLAFGERRLFEALSCSFPKGRISVLMGGSGSGKSTLLRMVAGLQRPDGGSIRVGDQEVVGRSEGALREVRRGLGMLFQNGALLDSMTVFENVSLPLREHRRLHGDELTRAVHERLAAVGLEGVDGLLPGELSGGMLRRVALARAIIMDPGIVLCDEPFSGLDPPNVGRIEKLFVSLCRERGLTLIVTSHHTASSLRMADQLVLLQHGQTVAGTPGSLATSGDPEIKDFLGADGELLARHLAHGGAAR